MGEISRGRPEPAGEPEVFVLRGGIAGDGGVRGTIFNACRGETVAFGGLDEALLMMNSWLTERTFLSEDMELRSFYRGKRKIRWVPRRCRKQSDASLIRRESFLIRVFFHEHTSWQGMVCWKNQGQYFRSVLELMSLIRSVLTDREGIEEAGKAAEKQSIQLPEKAG